MNIKMTAVLSAMMIAILSGCGTQNKKEDTGLATESKVSEADMSSEVTENSERMDKTDGVSSDVSEELFSDSVTDLALVVDKKEIEIGVDDSEVIFVVGNIVDRQKVELIDADNDNVVGEMFDDAEFEKSGDDIMGDCCYSLRYKLDDTFPTDPDVSENRQYHFYARYINGDTEHRSDVVEVFVYESFTDNELEKMDEARNRIKELRESEEFNALDDEEKKEKMLECLHELEDEGIVDKDSIRVDPEKKSITYSSCGIPVVIMLEPMPWGENNRYK